MTRIALVAPPMYPIPPSGYAGTERVIATLARELLRRGHDVTLIGPGDSEVPCRLIPTVDRALWVAGYRGDVVPYLRQSAAIAARHLGAFDIVHAHLEGYGLWLAGASGTPVVTTLHGRLDAADTSSLLGRFPESPVIAISNNQRRWFRANRWVGVVHHGLEFADLPLVDAPRPRLAVVGRATYEKGIAEAIEVARATGWPLTVAAKAFTAAEADFVRRVIEPAVADGVAEFVGEVSENRRDELIASSAVTLMLGGWPEPFGLVAIESMAQGTPVIGRRAGALPELVEHGIDGFLVDDVTEAIFALQRVATLDRARIRDRARRRFSVAAMADGYEAAYATLIGERVREAEPSTAMEVPSAVPGSPRRVESGSRSPRSGAPDPGARPVSTTGAGGSRGRDLRSPA